MTVSTQNADDTLRSERDSVATLGLLAHNYRLFDPGIATTQGGVTHQYGSNVHCFVVDNGDGEVLAIGRNSVHHDENPLQHGEQLVVRDAVDRIREKRPRRADMTVRQYYKTSMFMEAGSTPGDFLRKGCTLYNTFDPCAMCAVTMFFCYMKRVVYLFRHEEFETVYDDIKKRYFSKRESVKERVSLDSATSNLIDGTRHIVKCLDEKVERLVNEGVKPFLVVDHCRDEMEAATELLRSTSTADLITQGDDWRRNQRTLHDLQGACRLPVN